MTPLLQQPSHLDTQAAIPHLNAHTVEATFTTKSTFPNFEVSINLGAVSSTCPVELKSCRKTSEQMMAVTIPTKVMTERTRTMYDVFLSELMM